MNKRSILPFHMALCVFGLLPGRMFSQFADQKVSVAVVRGFPGKTVVIPVNISKAVQASYSVVALQADLMFDSSKLLVGRPTGGTALRGHTVLSSKPASGVLRLLFYSDTFQTLSNRSLALVPFTIGPGVVENQHVTLANVMLSTAAANPVGVARSSGGVAVEPVFQRVDGGVELFFGDVQDQPYVLQASTNLVDWVNIATNDATGSIVQFLDPDASLFPHRFYRTGLIDAATGTQVGNLTRLGKDRITFELASELNRTYLLQGSTDLVTWSNLSSNVASGRVLGYTNTLDLAVPFQFFRVKPAPR